MKQRFSLILCAILVVTAFAVVSCDGERTLNEQEFSTFNTSAVQTSEKATSESNFETTSPQETTSSLITQEIGKTPETTLWNTEETTISTTEAQTTAPIKETVDTSKNTEITTEIGNKKFTLVKYSNVSFLVPSNWEKQANFALPLFIAPNGTANISIISEKATINPYANLTLEGFRTMIKPSLEEQGLTITNESVANGINSNGIEITTTKFNSTTMNKTMVQIQFYVFKSGEFSVITLTQLASIYDPEIETLIYDSIDFITNLQ